MPSITLPTLENEFAKRAVTALAAGATTYVKPARFPKWVRRGVSMSNTLASFGLAALGDRKPAVHSMANSATHDVVEVANGVTVPRSGANWAAAAAAGMGLVSSGLAIKVDARIEKALLKRGVPNPRLIMAVGAAGLSLAGPWISRAAQKVGTKVQEKAATNPTLRPGADEGRGSAGTKGLDAGMGESSVRHDEQEQGDQTQQGSED